MTSLRQAFSKLYEGLSNDERAKNPHLGEGLGVAPSRRDAYKTGDGGKKSKPGGPAERPASIQAAPGQADKPLKVKYGKLAPEAPSAAEPPKARKPAPVKPQETPTHSRAIGRAKAASPGSLDVARYLPEEPVREAGLVRTHCPPDEAPKTAPIEAIKQFLGIRRSITSLRIQVGLDFGTSVTKLLYRVQGQAGQTVQVLGIGHELPGVPEFFVPSLVAISKKGELLLGHLAARALHGADWRAGISGFKMLVAGREDPRFLDADMDARYQAHLKTGTGNDARFTPAAIAATYLAYVMRRARLALAREFPGYSLDVSFNTCVPIEQREHPVSNLFERLFQVAERLDVETRQTAKTTWWADEAERLLKADASPIEHSRVFVVPEAVAAVAAYLTSLSRADGLHALVDIGSGTTDVSIFHLATNRSTGLQSTWLSAKSIPLAATHIENEIASALRANAYSDPITRDVVLACMSGDDALGQLSSGAVERSLAAIWNESTDAWRDAYPKLKGESFWTRDRVRVLLAGGGGLVPTAKSVFAHSWYRGWGPYSCQVIPDPGADANKSSTRVPFARICVAYGLTIPVPELGDYVLPGDAPNMTPPPLPRREYLQDGDQLVPRYGWT